MAEINDRYLKVEHVSKILSCTDQHIYDLIREGSLRGVKVGSRAVRISELSLQEFLASNTINPEDFYDPDREKTKEVKKEPPPVAKSRWMGKT